MRDNKTRIIYLLRHGHIQTRDNEHHYIGQIDLPLSSEGVRQSRLLQNQLNRKNFSTLFCSDLKRSFDTAAIIANGNDKNIIVKSSFREISMGDWEGKSFSEIKRDFPGEYVKRGNNIADYRISGGESFRECQSRIIASFFDIVKSSGGDIVIVGHAGANRALICYFLGMPLENIFRISQDYGCINILLYNNGTCQVKTLNTNTF